MVDETSFTAVAAEMQSNLEAIDKNLDRLTAENKQMRGLLSQAALFVAMQPENTFRKRWLAEVKELLHV